MLSQVQGHKPCLYVIKRVALLFEPRWFSETSNEIASFGSGRGPIDVDAKGVHTQRTTNLLAGKKRKVEGRVVAGVDYVVTFHLLCPEIKYLNMTLSRLRSGRYYGDHPFLGIRGLAARLDLIADLRDITYPTRADDDSPEVRLVEHRNGQKSIDRSERLGLCFYGTDWDDPKRPNYFAPLDMKRGIIEYPSWDEVRKLGIKREAAA
jgi:hypothetical protein